MTTSGVVSKDIDNDILIGPYATELFRYCYTRGLALLGYGVLWLAGMLAMLLLLDRFFGGGGLASNLAAAVVAAAAGGGIGGAAALIDRLYRHIASQQDFPGQSLTVYLLQPLSGLLAGLLVFGIIAIPASLIVNYAAHGQFLTAQSFTSPAFTALQMLLAWTAGFYQLRGFEKVKSTFIKAKVEALDRAVTQQTEAPLSFNHWYERQLLIRRWSYTWGGFVAVYGLLWIAGLVGGYLLLEQSLLFPEPASAVAATALIVAALPTIIAGGIGGAVGALRDLYEHISYEQDFHRQHLISYLVQPLLGLVFGGVIYFLVASGYLSLQPLFSGAPPPMIVDVPTVIFVQMSVGWMAGFRQRLVGQVVQRLIQDAVDFFKLAAQLLNPFVLFNKTKRTEVLRQLSRKNELFKPLTEESDDAGEPFKWWAPD